MNSLKSLPMAAVTVLGLGVASSFAEIKLTDNLGVAGFLDMSASGYTDEDTNTLIASFDQFELDFMYKFGDKISARADLAYGGVGGGSTILPGSLGGVGAVALEQAFAAYSAGGWGFATGRFLSSSGFEAAEPTGMYQFSYSENITGPAGPVYGGYQNGVNAWYSTSMFGLYGAVVTDLWSTTETDLLTPGFEGQLTLTPVEGITAKAAYLYQMYDEDITGKSDQQLLNIWGSFGKGPFIVAAEYNLLLDWGAGDETGHGWLAMGNFKFTETIAATLRYSGMLLGDNDAAQEVTFSPSLALSPNWLALAEVRYDLPWDDAAGVETISNVSYALETTFSF